MINSKRKGKVGELEVVNLLKEKGLTARRTQQFSGKADGVSPPEGIELPEIEVSKATIRETVVGKDGKTYEVEK